MERTTNYKLPRWVESDRIMMEDFNDAMAKIDAGIAGAKTAADSKAAAEAVAALQTALGTHGHNCRVAYGSYTGVGVSGQAHPTAISCGFYPVMALVYSGAWDTRGHSVFMRGLNTYVGEVGAGVACPVTWSDSSFSWYTTQTDEYAPTKQLNAAGQIYYYVVLGYDR